MKKCTVFNKNNKPIDFLLGEKLEMGYRFVGDYALQDGDIVVFDDWAERIEAEHDGLYSNGQSAPSVLDQLNQQAAVIEMLMLGGM